MCLNGDALCAETPSTNTIAYFSSFSQLLKCVPEGVLGGFSDSSFIVSVGFSAVFW